MDVLWPSSLVVIVVLNHVVVHALINTESHCLTIIAISDS